MIAENKGAGMENFFKGFRRLCLTCKKLEFAQTKTLTGLENCCQISKGSLKTNCPYWAEKEEEEEKN